MNVHSPAIADMGVEFHFQLLMENSIGHLKEALEMFWPQFPSFVLLKWGYERCLPHQYMGYDW